jgi:outer membrane protein, heavy metal efflux system
MKIPSTILSGLLVAGSLLHAEETRLLDDSLLAALRAEASRQHPAAKSAALLATAAARDLRGVRLWDDPMVGLALMAAEKSKRRDDGDIRLSYEQPLPKPGLFQANLTKADALRRAGIENSVSSTLEVGAAAAKDAIELALTDESISLQSTQIQWLGTMAENARQMALNPSSTSIDALRLESEVARENQVLAAARRTRSSLARTLNLRLGRPLESPWPLLKLPVNPSPIPIASSEIARIPNSNPKVRSMREMASAAAAEIRINHSERKPQLSVGVDADLYSGGDFRSASVGLKMSLPYFNRTSYDAKIAAATLREKAAIADIESARLEVASAVLSTVADVANSAAQARAYSGEIYQRSLQATQAVESAWISSKSSLTDLLDANRTLFSIRLEQRRFIAMQQAALQELQLLVPNRR